MIMSGLEHYRVYSPATRTKLKDVSRSTCADKSILPKSIDPANQRYLASYIPSHKRPLLSRCDAGGDTDRQSSSAFCPDPAPFGDAYEKFGTTQHGACTKMTRCFGVDLLQISIFILLFRSHILVQSCFIHLRQVPYGMHPQIHQEHAPTTICGGIDDGIDTRSPPFYSQTRVIWAAPNSLRSQCHAPPHDTHPWAHSLSIRRRRIRSILRRPIVVSSNLGNSKSAHGISCLRSLLQTLTLKHFLASTYAAHREPFVRNHG
jgi:hypothetical protein